MKRFKIQVARTEYLNKEVIIEAETQKEAEELARETEQGEYQCVSAEDFLNGTKETDEAPPVEPEELPRECPEDATILVWDCTFYTDEDGVITKYQAPELDFSHIAEYPNPSDLVRIDG